MAETLAVKARLPIVIQRAVITKFKLSWRGLLAYTALSYLAGDQGLSLGTRQLAELFSISENTLRRGLRELLQKKAITARPVRKKKNGKFIQLPNEYTLLDVSDSQVPI